MSYASRTRSTAKAVTWMTLATVSGFLLLYILTNELTLAMGFASINFAIKSILYYLHERGWNSIHWGMSSGSENDGI
jgi:adenylylsulfate kinase